MRNFRRAAFGVLAISTMAIASSSIRIEAQETTNPPKSLEERLEEIDQRVRISDRKRELDKEAADEKAKTAARVAAGRSGFSLTSADSAYSLRIRGYTQADGRFVAEESRVPGTINTFLLRRVRPIFEGTVARSFDFRIMLDFGGGVASVQDGHVDARFSRAVKLRAGKMKPPFGIERLQSGAEILFIERGLPTNLVPNRDVGAQIFGDLAQDRIGYAAGIFNGVPDGSSGDIDTNNEKEGVGRVMAAPLKTATSPWLSGISVGMAASYGNNKATAAATGLAGYRAPSQQIFFSYRGAGGVDSTTVVANGRRLRYSPQATLYAGRIGLLGEFVASKNEVRIGANEAELAHESWQVTGSYVLTGETPSFRGVTPKRPWERATGGKGAFEIAGRYGALTADSASFPLYANPVSAARRAESWGAGVNWYINRNVKLVVDYDQTQFDGGARDADRKTEKLFGQRLQISF